MRIVALFIGLFALHAQHFTYAQQENCVYREQQTKFIVNFTLFTEWPEESQFNSNTDTLKIGIFGSEGFRDTLQLAFENAAFFDKPVVFSTIALSDKVSDFHVLVFDRNNDQATKTLTHKVKKMPVLTICTHCCAEVSPALINFRQSGQGLGFTINQQAAKVAGLKFRYQLYQQATIINPVNY